MGKLVEVVIDSLRVSLTNQQRVVVLHEKETNNYLPIWIGPYEAEAITIALQDVEVSRPLTHDLLKNVFTRLKGKLLRIEIAALKDDVFYAKIMVEQNDEILEIDSRPSDAIAISVRAHIPIFVDSEVMDQAGIHPETELPEKEGSAPEPAEATETGGEQRLSVFEDFLKKFDLDDQETDSGDSKDSPDQPSDA